MQTKEEFEEQSALLEECPWCEIVKMISGLPAADSNEDSINLASEILDLIDASGYSNRTRLVALAAVLHTRILMNIKLTGGN